MEYRILLRHDNADRRLTPIAREAGLINDDRWNKLQTKEQQISLAQHALESHRHNGIPLDQILRRQDVTWANLCELDPELSDIELSPESMEQVVTECKYSGYVRRQEAQIQKLQQTQGVRIPEHFAYHGIPQLRAEAKEKLMRIQPRSLGQAGRISGITPADLAILMLYLKEPDRLAL